VGCEIEPPKIKNVEATEHTPEPTVEKSIKSEEPKAEESESKPLEVAEAAAATVVASEVIESEEPKEKVDSIPTTSEVVEPTPTPVIEKEEEQPQIESKEFEAPITEAVAPVEESSIPTTESPEVAAPVIEKEQTPEIESKEVKGEIETPRKEDNKTSIPQIEEPTTEVVEGYQVPAEESKVEEIPLSLEEKSIEPKVFGELKSEEIPKIESTPVVSLFSSS